MSLHLDISNPQAEARLVAAADQRGIDIAALVETMAVDFLPPAKSADAPAKVRTAGEIARKVGFVKGLPSDLSTNPEYMKGFGQTINHRDLTQ